MAIPSPWLVINITMYGTPPTCTVIFSITEGVELEKLGALANFMLNWLVWWYGRFLKHIRELITDLFIA